MNRQELVYALNHTHYYQTTRDSQHPSIVQAKKRNVNLTYTRCNEIYSGQSKFLDPKQEQFFNRSCKSLPAKSKMFKSQITDAPSTVGQPANCKLNDLNQLARKYQEKRGNMARSFHGSFHSMSSATLTKERIYNTPQVNRNPSNDTESPEREREGEKYLESYSSQTLRIEKDKYFSQGPIKNLTATFHQNSRKKSVYLDDEQERIQTPRSIHMEQKTDSPESKKEFTPLMKRQDSSSKFYQNITPHNYEPKGGYLKIKTEKTCGEKKFSTISHKNDEQLSEVQMLRKMLSERDREIERLKRNLEDSEKKQKNIEGELKWMKEKGKQVKSNVIRLSSSIITAKKEVPSVVASEQLCKEMGSMQALLYLAFFLVLVCKDKYRI